MKFDCSDLLATHIVEQRFVLCFMVCLRLATDYQMYPMYETCLLPCYQRCKTSLPEILLAPFFLSLFTACCRVHLPSCVDPADVEIQVNHVFCYHFVM